MEETGPLVPCLSPHWTQTCAPEAGLLCGARSQGWQRVSGFLPQRWGQAVGAHRQFRVYSPWSAPGRSRF